MAEPKTVKKPRNKGANRQREAVTNPDSGSNTMFMVALGAILLLGLAAVAFFVTNREGVDLDAPQTAEVELDGNILIPMSGSGVSADPAQDAAIGQPAPSVSGTDFDGTPVTIEDDGRAKVIYFLAHWCPHCQAEVPRIVELINAGSQPADLDLYGVSTAVDASRGNYPASFWLDQEGLDIPVIRDSDSSDALNFFGNGGFPYAVYIDADNNIVARSSGEVPIETMGSLWNITAGDLDGGAETESE